jgi:hypothetical protein
VPIEPTRFVVLTDDVLSVCCRVVRVSVTLIVHETECFFACILVVVGWVGLAQIGTDFSIVQLVPRPQIPQDILVDVPPRT